MSTLIAQNPDLSARLEQNYQAAREVVVAMAQDIHAHPELSFEERRAAGTIAQVLRDAGFEVAEGICDIPTAFEGTIGHGGLVVGICVEYDSLPGVGHACGHNLIAGSTVGAALALAPLVDELGITLKAIGTPAEEHGGGKALLLERGAFDGVGLSLMAHPGSEGGSTNPLGTTTQAVGRFKAMFHGQAAHAAAMPDRGVNAADAATIAQVAIGLLRQQLPDNHRVASYIAEAGHVTNIIPDYSEVHFEVRAFSLDAYEQTLAKVRRCFEGAATATGTTLEFEATEPVYEPVLQDDALGTFWNDAMAARGVDVTLLAAGTGGGGSTDMGNISQVIPAIHPMFPVPGASAPIHSAGFTAAANTGQAYSAMDDAALSLAATVAAGVLADRDRYLSAAYRRA
ncbi:M20 family metallopeptidase [Glutamicibacter sp. TV12E]|uniref:M20 family metallopeptidase n=1 Tax=Glutamicibacter sp. TV12E TaxID=3446362 RepID=UPI004034C4C2